MAQAAEITRAEADSPGSESELVAVAQSSGLSVLKHRARKLRLAAVSAEELAARQHRARSFRHWSDEGGMIRFSGALEPVVGVALMNRLDAEADRLRREAGAAGRGYESREAHGADALVAMVSGEARAKAKAKGGRAELVIVCDRRAYARGYTEGDEVCHVVGGSPVPVAEARKLVEGDAFVKAVVHDGTRIDTVVHFGRHISAQLRTALELSAARWNYGHVCDAAPKLSRGLRPLSQTCP